METLEKIFGSANKVKIMRMFLFNPQIVFDLKEIARRTKMPSAKASREIATLEKAGLIKSKVFFKEIKTPTKKKISKPKKKKAKGWILDREFAYLLPLQNFLVHISNSQQKEIVKKLKKLGSIKLLILSGVFIQEWESRADIVIVGDRMKASSVGNIMSQIEAEVGKEINYCYFETPNFLYRLGVCDKLIRDILDYPHKKIINRLELS
jgi:hypothetical protein